jgi:hypothetical protein
MAIDINYKRDKGFLYIMVKGHSTIEEYEKVMEEMTKSEQYPADVNTMWDVREQEFNDFDSDTINRFLSIRKRYPERGTARVAFIVKGDFAFGMMRMYDILSSLEGSKLPQNLMVFRDYSEGEKWLLGEQS